MIEHCVQTEPLQAARRVNVGTGLQLYSTSNTSIFGRAPPAPQIEFQNSGPSIDEEYIVVHSCEVS